VGWGNLTLGILAWRLQDNHLILVSYYYKEGKPLSDALCEVMLLLRLHEGVYSPDELEVVTDPCPLCEEGQLASSNTLATCWNCYMPSQPRSNALACFYSHVLPFVAALNSPT
jgi:hypothetical protein